MPATIGLSNIFVLSAPEPIAADLSITSIKSGFTFAMPHTKKMSYQEQKDYETIEQDIASLEEQLEQLEQDIVGAATDFVRLNELTAQKSEIEAALEQKMDRWMYLEELAEELGLK